MTAKPSLLQAACLSLLAPALAVAAFAAGSLSARDAAAQQSVESFYKGKQMKFIIRSAPGGGFDTYSRLMARHITKHIPGQPTMLPQNMPGAGGITAANYMGEIAPKDGTHLTMIGQALPMDQSLGLTPTFKADLRSFGWVGNIGDSNVLTYVWHTSPTKTMADAKKKETTLGATGAGDTSSWIPAVYNKVLGTKFKIIDGYKSGSEVKLAMERGEVEGFGSNPYSALMSASPQLVRDKQISILVQVGVRKEKDLPNVPLLNELADNADDKAVLDFISKALAVGRPIGTTPGVPAERVTALRKAFDTTLTDPDFIADATKIGAEINPMNGEVLQALVGEVMGAPQSIKDKVKAVLPDRAAN
ncbi:MAG TPA: tripartite tricarboxylate transporter substrate-binding protein [Alphaproteobacteria bacterium]|nr:tripartite tricarboxylate transporter substrate-binding protein [Alphaproteobacteria bacterium]